MEAPEICEPVPRFDAKGCRYDQRTYAGRLRRFRDMTDPRMLLISDDELSKVRGASEERVAAELVLCRLSVAGRLAAG